MDFIRDLIKKTDVDYYDFNLCREKYFPFTSSLFMDHDHLNRSGSELFSNLLADLVNGDISKDELFYDSYAEKLEAMDPTVFGVSYCDSKNENGESIRECRIISTKEPDLEYKILLSPTGGDPYSIQDFATNRFFTIAPEEHGTMAISYRLGSAPDIVWDVNITY